MIILSGAASASSTIHQSWHRNPRRVRFTITIGQAVSEPLSYATILGGAYTWIGTFPPSLGQRRARNAGQAAFSLLEIAPVANCTAAAGAIYPLLFVGRLLGGANSWQAKGPYQVEPELLLQDDRRIFPVNRLLQPPPGFTPLMVFIGGIAVAACNLAPIASAAFSDTVMLIVTQTICAGDAYKGLWPEILLLIAGIVVIGFRWRSRD